MTHFFSSRLLAGLLLCCSLLLPFGALADCTTPRTIRSAQNGNFSTGSTWVGGVAPTSCDFVIIDHTVTNTNFTIGQNGTGGMVINNGASVSGSGLTLGNNNPYTLTNNGTLNIGSLSFNGTGGAAFYNNATATFSNSQTWNAGSLVVNRGYMTVNGSILQNDGVFRNDAIYGSLTLSGTITLNGNTTWNNIGRIVSTSTNNSQGFYLQGTSSTFYNRATGRLTMLNGGLYQSGGTFLYNENYIGVKNLETHDGAIMQSTDSVMVSSNFINGDIFNNYAGAYIRVGADFNQINKTGSILSNDGLVQIIGNFINDKAIGGNGGGFTVGGTSTNQSAAVVTGSIDFCDASVTGFHTIGGNTYPDIFDINNNTSSGTNYGVATATTRCQYIAPTASLKSADISGAATVCANSTGNVFSIPAVTGATSYQWTVSSGYTITAGQGTRSIAVTAGPAAGVVTVKVLGSGTNYNYTSKLVQVTTGTPGQPGNMQGPVSAVCAGTGGYTYAVAAVSGATYYSWSVPSDWTINYGQGTTSISVTVGSASGNVSVSAGSACGSGAARTLAVAPVAALATPTLTGNAAVCTNQNQTYTAGTVSGAIGYRWTVPSGWNIQTSQTPSGSGLYPASITVTVGGSTGTNNVTVAASSNCGDGTAASLAVTATSGSLGGNPSFAGSSGTTNAPTPCANTSGFVYTVNAVSGAVNYNWSIPSGWAVTSPTGISGTSFTSSSSTITVTPSTTAGQISVSASTACGSTSGNTTFNVAPQDRPMAPTITAGPTAFCPGSSYSYSASIPSGTTVSWTAPSGWTVGTPTVSGTTSMVSITATSAAVSGNISAIATNNSGSPQCQSTAATRAVASNSPTPAFTTTTTTTNVGAVKTASSYTYQINGTGASTTSYSWTLPTGWVITATSPAGGALGGTTTTVSGASNPATVSVTVTAGATSGNLQVTGTNGSVNCISTAATLAVAADQNAAYAASAYSAAKKRTCYATNDVLYTVSDPDGSIVSAALKSGSSLPAGVALNTSTGALTVSNASLLTTGPTSFIVVTTDSKGGVSETTLTMTFPADEAPTVTVAPSKTLQAYSNGDVLATYSDPDGAITSILLASGALPRGTALSTSGSNGVLTVTNAALLTPGSYSFTVQTSNASCSIGLGSTSTSMRIGSSQALPVSLTSFVARRNGRPAQLNWATATEKDNAFFVVQRSLDGLSFVEVGRLEGHGTTSTVQQYSFVDASAPAALTYYRLQQVDYDGTAHYSDVRTLAATGEAVRLSATAYPNPTAGAVTVQIEGTTAPEPVQISICTPVGTVLSSYTAEATGRQFTADLSRLPAGMYLVRLRIGQQQTMLRVSKQ